MSKKFILKNAPCAALLIISLLEAQNLLIEKMPDADPLLWKWKYLHRQRLAHLPFTETPLRFFFDRTFYSSGTRRTVYVSTYNMRKEEFDGIHGGNYIMIVSLAKNDTDFYLLDSGVSDNVFSRHYDDQMGLYKRQELIEMKSGIEFLDFYSQKLVLRTARYEDYNYKSNL